MEKNLQDLDNFFDIIVVDRGFRDTIDYIKEKGINSKS